MEKSNIFSENLSHCQVFSTNCQKMTLWHHWGVSQGASDTPVMPFMMGVVTDAPCGHKTTLNIDIYPYTLFFFFNIGHKYDFEGGGTWWGLGVGGGPDPKKKSFNRILIHIYLQSMFRLSYQ